MEQGYQPNHITMSALEGNILAIFAALPFIVSLLIIYLGIGNELSIEGSDLLTAYIIFLVLILVHEFIHGITWAFFSPKGWKSISFGFIAEYLTPYCSCNEPMKKHQIIIGALMPTIVLGFVPGIIAIFIGSSLLIFVAILMILGGRSRFVNNLQVIVTQKCIEGCFIY